MRGCLALASTALDMTQEWQSPSVFNKLGDEEGAVGRKSKLEREEWMNEGVRHC